jgi:hypothetical protein
VLTKQLLATGKRKEKGSVLTFDTVKKKLTRETLILLRSAAAGLPSPLETENGVVSNDAGDALASYSLMVVGYWRSPIRTGGLRRGLSVLCPLLVWLRTRGRLATEVERSDYCVTKGSRRRSVATSFGRALRQNMLRQLC